MSEEVGAANDLEGDGGITGGMACVLGGREGEVKCACFLGGGGVKCECVCV